MSDADRLRRQAEAQARYRKRHPEKVRAAQAAQDARPERMERQRLRAKKKRSSPEHKEKIRKYRQRQEVKERAKQQRKSPTRKAALRAWRMTAKQRAKRAARMRALRKSPRGLVENRLRAALWRGLNDGVERRRQWFEILGYSVSDLKAHLERQFLRGMSWDNAGDWHIDHIVPLSSFTYSSPDDAAFIAAWSLTNLRPLWGAANLRKGGRREHLL